MNKQQIIISEVSIETNLELTIDELCLACQVTPDFLEELLNYGAFEIENSTLDAYRFDSEDLRRIRSIKQLQHDLEVNVPGALLIVDLLDEMADMHAKIEMLEKHLRHY